MVMLFVVAISYVRKYDLEKDTKQKPSGPPNNEMQRRQDKLWTKEAAAGTSLQDWATARWKPHNHKYNYRDSLQQKYVEKIIRLTEIYGNQSPPVQNAQAVCVWPRIPSPLSLFLSLPFLSLSLSL